MAVHAPEGIKLVKRIKDAGFKTREGIGVGSSVKDVKKTFKYGTMKYSENQNQNYWEFKKTYFFVNDTVVTRILITQ